MSKLKINFLGGIGFEVQARHHSLTIDLSPEKGGRDQGMNPPEVFMASLGSCIGVYVVRYCDRVKLDASALHIEVDWRMSDDKSRISHIDVKISLPNVENTAAADAVLNTARRCLIHNTILGHPEITMTLG